MLGLASASHIVSDLGLSKPAYFCHSRYSSVDVDLIENQGMKQAPLRILIAWIGLTLFGLITNGLAEFPEKPIHFIVYTGPGGLMDVTTRKLVDIIKKQHPELEIVVENKKGAGGLVALSYLLGKQADGYYVLGITSSVISKIVSVHQQAQLNNVDYLIRLVADFECLITKRDTNLDSLAEIKNNAEAKSGNQLWVGPDGGGTDHLFAQAVWDELDISAKWIPYPSGGEAVAALMGQHGQIYVGNPQDVQGRESLQVVAVASPQRLPSLPQVPTFKELGYPNLTNSTLWRGFVIKRGTPAPAAEKITALIEEATEHQDWKNFITRGNMVATSESGQEFAALVGQQMKSDTRYLR